MHAILRIAAFTAAVAGVILHSAHAQETNLLPKYGALAKNEVQRLADDQFLSDMDRQYAGNRLQASQELALRGWQALRQGSVKDAMRRFNQAWLLDRGNGRALWGMGGVQGTAGMLADALMLFQEAEPLISDDVDFAVDHARTLAMVAIQANDASGVSQALERFSRVDARAPQHTHNLQNWAITLFHLGRYDEAWKKIGIAQTTSRHTELDPVFIAELKKKMPAP